MEALIQPRWAGSLEKWRTFRRTWLGSRAGRGLLSRVKVGLSPVRVGRSVGLLVRIHWRVSLGSAIFAFVDVLEESACGGMVCLFGVSL